jgi:hypothetical protein
MVPSWFPYGAVIIITLMTIRHFLKTRKSYSPGIAASILGCHASCIGMLWLFAGSTPLNVLSLVWLGGFLLASVASIAVSEVDQKKRSVQPGTHAYAARDGLMAIFFVVSVMVLVTVFT